MRRALVLALVALGAACSGGDDDGCVARAGDYALALGPGTGTCDATRFDPIAALGVVSVGEGDGCGRQILATAADGAGCTVNLELEATVTATGVTDGVVRVTGDCRADGAECEHSFLIDFMLTSPDAP